MKSIALLSVAALAVLVSCGSAPRMVTDTANAPVSYLLEVRILDGKEEAFAGLMAEMVASTLSEPGTLAYGWYVSEDGRRCHIDERYADTAACRAHGDNFFAKFAARFMECVSIEGVTVYGEADSEVRGMLADLEPAYFRAVGGFER